jgi:hypothetical protein
MFYGFSSDWQWQYKHTQYKKQNPDRLDKSMMSQSDERLQMTALNANMGIILENTIMSIGQARQ